MNLLLLFFVGVLPAIVADPEPSALTAGVYAQFQHEPPQAVLEAMHQEVNSIMAPIGLRMAWRSLDRNANEAWGALAVIRFKGMCNTEDLTVYPEYPFILGQTYTVDGAIIPFSDIHCNAVRAMLASWLIPLKSEQRDRVFGRAVGRVVAHELYHVFSKTKHHGSRGVAERAFSLKHLVMEDFQFDSNQGRKLVSSLCPNFLQLAGAIPRFAPVYWTLFIKSGCVGCHGAHGEGTGFGPPLRPVANSYDFAKLSRRLKDKRTLMYERARRLGALWPPLTDQDVGTLAAFVRSLGRESGLIAAAGGQ